MRDLYLSFRFASDDTGAPQHGDTLFATCRLKAHFLPGFAILAFVGLMLLAQPPIVFAVANRIEPWILGMPFLYAWLLGVYLAMIGVLLWVQGQRL